MLEESISFVRSILSAPQFVLAEHFFKPCYYDPFLNNSLHGSLHQHPWSVAVDITIVVILHCTVNKRTECEPSQFLCVFCARFESVCQLLTGITVPHFFGFPSPSNKAGWAFTVNCSGINN